ncbi:MAG: non-ribosomal peptide synthetase, partial [Candidatus Promineifilaceae bacterium]
QVSFTLQNTPQSPSDLTDLTVEQIRSAERGTSKFDLSLTITFRDGALGGSLAYRTDLFKAKTIQRMISHYQRLLEAIVECPDCTIGHLPMLSESELRQLLVEWNHTSAPYPRESTIDAVFETQARNTPQAAAVYFEGQTLTYAELDQRANQVAHFLIERGVKPGEIVGLACERSPELIIAMLAILKAGAAYLPLDKEHPHERLNRMLEEAQCRYIVTHKELHLPVSAATRLFNLDNAEVSGAIERQSNENVQRPASSSSLQLAYVMFTSGSSGQPKGVMVPHRAVVRLVKNASFAVLDSAQRFLQFAPVSFDASTFEIWGPLLNGGQLFIYPPESASLSRLARYVRENRITTLWLTAGLFQQMVEHEPDCLAGIDHVLTGGDVVSAQHARQLMQAGGRCRLSNAYGPTENTTFTTCFTMTTAAGIGDTLPIGRPISNTTVYLLDANLQPVPIGLPGELYTGGDGVALGYLNRPELTQEAFIPDPFSGREGDHLYRTGDLARYTADGNIEFLGRMDDQVKIRGFRVEPGEIEHVLLQHPVVREAAVLAHEEEPGDKRLTAYLVLEDHYSSAVVDELHSLCSKKLPAYMVPAAFAVVEKMPLTINGKIDRAALLALDTAVYPERPMYVSPRTPEEAAVAAIWQELLRIDPVGVFDNFFELGGHSLLATQVVARISRIYQVELTLHLLFEKPTVAAIAAEVLELVARRDDHRRKMEEALTRIKELTPAERADLLSSLEQTTVEESKNDG